jgi:hypothetical protein
MDNQITTEQARKICELSRSQWNRLRKAGKTPAPISLIGRNWIYNADDVRLFATSRKA